MLQKVKLQVLSVLVAAFAIALFPAALLGTASTADAQSPRVETMSKSVKSMIRSLRANARLLNKKISKLQRKRLRKGTRPSARELRLVKKLSHTLEQMALVSGQMPTGDRLALSVTSGLRFFLIDAARDEVVRELFGEVELREDDARRVNIIAVLPEGMQAGSVIFSRDANSEVARENVAPYALFGDNSRGDYQEGIFALGTHTVRARAYSGRNGGGTLLLEEEVTISVTPEQEPEQVELTLVETRTGQSIASVTDGMRIDLAQHSGINILASSPLSAVRSVRFTYGGESSVESYAPYALAGDGGEGVYYPWDAPLGSVSLKVELFSERNAAGSLLASRIVALSIVRTVVPTPTPTPTPSVPPTPPATRTPTPTPTPSPSATPPPPPSGPGGNLWADYHFTNISPAPGARVVYVDCQSGNDSRDGLSPATARRTIRMAIRAFLPNSEGQPNQLRLKRGCTFESTGISGDATGYYDYVSFRGPSLERPAVIADYGDPSAERPILIPEDEHGRVISVQGNVIIRNLVIANIMFRPRSAESFNGEPLKVVGGGFDNVIIENVDIRFFRDGIVLQSQDASDPIENVRIRRSVILGNGHGGAFSGEGTTNGSTAWLNRASGLYATHTKNLIIEDNVFGYNGWTSWHPRVFASAQGLSASWRTDPRFNANIYSHEIYLQKSDQFPTVRNNIFVEASSHAIQARGGGEIHGNVAIRAPLGIMVGSIEATRDLNDRIAEGRVTNNLLLELNDISRFHAGEGRGGWAIEAGPGEEFLISDNVVANTTATASEPRTFQIAAGSSADIGRQVTFIGNRVLNVPNPFVVYGDYIPGSNIGVPELNVFTMNRLNTFLRASSSRIVVGQAPNQIIRRNGTRSAQTPARAFDNMNVSETLPLINNVYPGFYSLVRQDPLQFRAREIRRVYGMNN